MIVAFGVLYAQLFRIDTREYIPFLCLGLLTWGLISSFLNEAGGLFTSCELLIKQIRLPFTVYVWRFVWTRIIVFLHNIIIYFGVLAYFEFWPGMAMLGAIVGLVILLLNGFLVSLYVGMISLRFRDVPQMIAAATQIVFFLTPIMWKPELLEGNHYIVNWNPFYHLIELVRAPLLGQWVSPTTVAVTASITLVNLAIAVMIFFRFRSRIPFWI